MGDPKSVDPAAPGTVDPSPPKSIDPAAIEMLQHADDCGIDTAFTRADDMKPCPIGESGACCRICSMGPCRLVGKDAEEKTGVCGADLPTIASRHFARQVAGGVAAHSDHGRDMAHTLLAAANGAAPDYVIKDEQKLMVVAGYLGVATTGRETSTRSPSRSPRSRWPSSASRTARSSTPSAPRPSGRRSGRSSASPRGPSTARSPRSCTAPTRASTSMPRTS